LQKHIEFNGVFKLTYNSNKENQENKLKLLDNEINNRVIDSINKNRLLNKSRGTNEMRVTSCKVRIDNIGNLDFDSNTTNIQNNFLKDRPDLNISKNFAIKSSQKNNAKCINESLEKEKFKIYKSTIFPGSEKKIVKFDDIHFTEKKHMSKKSFFIKDSKLANIKKKSNINTIINYCNEDCNNRNSPIFNLKYNKKRKISTANQLRNKLSPSNNNMRSNFLNVNLYKNFDRKSKEIDQDEFSKRKELMRPMSVATKFRIDPSITKTTKKWLNYNKEFMARYSTGNFNLPLVSKHLN